MSIYYHFLFLFYCIDSICINYKKVRIIFFSIHNRKKYKNFIIIYLPLHIQYKIFINKNIQCAF
uniref:Uncharacterized protein orf63b n=1 Tax=Chara vulgaris TaxID=55564 RepID=Q1ACH7_CHAVU|nr:hypothetical protein ChvuCp067 [Chara vulgaris]ABA61996.1 hypothetical protein [Chara vulgaris]